MDCKCGVGAVSWCCKELEHRSPGTSWNPQTQLLTVVRVPGRSRLKGTHQLL